jgi:TetR/AcrR family transcriptional regulator, mexJK operon transcriptional repressor
MAEADADDGLIVRIRPRAVDGEPGTRVVEGKRAAIARAATELFLSQGYRATSTEQVASAAGVSKQTVYNQFGDKERLFREIVLGVTATAEAFADGVTEVVGGVDTPSELDAALRTLARRYLGTVMNPQVLALRRLVISEASRVPDLAATYYERGPSRVLAALGELFGGLAERGLLQPDAGTRAAGDFAFLLLGRALDEGMFRVGEPVLTPTGIDEAADHAVDVFLAAHGTEPPSSRAP